MLALITRLSSLLVCRFRSRAALELEVVALRHQLAVLRRQQPGRPKPTSLDRLLWVLLYRTLRADSKFETPSLALIACRSRSSAVALAALARHFDFLSVYRSFQ